MGVARSSYYYKRSEKKVREDARLRGMIEDVIAEYAGYGYRRVTVELKRRGEQVNHKRVHRVMRESQLLCSATKRKAPGMWREGHAEDYSNLIKGMVVTGLNQIWVSDITYIEIGDRFAYLAVILDAYSRKAVGWAVSRRLNSAMAMKALQMALSKRCPPHGCIHHSDRGVQYTSCKYLDTLKAKGLRISLSRKGTPGDNPQAESFMKTLKYEEVYQWDYESFADVQSRVPYFIEEVYNKRRLHSALGYCPPNEFESMADSSQAVQKPVLECVQ